MVMKRLRCGILLLLLFFSVDLCCGEKKHKKGAQKIVDCFLFFNELELLTVRLEELYDHVDYFVLVEAAETFRGNPKPYIFEENKARFQKYLSKIIHVKVEDRKPHYGVWEREGFHRNCIRRGLAFCKKNDIILMSDFGQFMYILIPPFNCRKLHFLPK